MPNRSASPAELPLLPFGYQVFRNIRNEGAVYVDKTRYMTTLKKLGQVVFCARPRRFGKSLTVSTLDDLFSGRRELFRGLAAETLLDSPSFVPRPVIRLDMSRIGGGTTSRDEIKSRLKGMLDSEARRHNLKIPYDDPVTCLNFLLEEVSRASGEKSVLLIAEYDSPVLNVVTQPAINRDERLIAQTRDLMRAFYAQIKASEANLYFTFITGISKFSRMGVFSSLNNICDISLEPEYAAFMGITHGELTANFALFIARAAEKFGVDPEEMTEHIRAYYNGFSFDGETLVYNPFSTLGFFSRLKFDNFWMESGSASFIREFLRDKRLTVDQFRGVPVDRFFAGVPGEIEKTSPEGFLYQSGYLTLRKGQGEGFTLDYPNFEVSSAMSRFFIDNFYPSEAEASGAVLNVVNRFDAGDVPGLVDAFSRMYAAVDYSDYLEAERKKLGESCYRSVLLSFLCGAGITARAEEHGNLGRTDIVAERKGKALIIEMKFASGPEAAEAAALAGMEQIRVREYGNRYPDRLRLSLAIDEKRRNIGAWLAESADAVPVPDASTG